MKRTDDFFGDLEAQLATAAAARTAGARSRPSRSWLRPAVAYAAALAAIAVAIVGIATLTSDRAGDEIPATMPTPAPTTGPTLPDGTSNPAADCPIHPDLPKVFPAIADPPDQPKEMLPDLVTARVRSDWRYPDLRLARRLEADDGSAGYTFYAVPIGACPEKGLDGPSDLVALYVFRDGTFVTSDVQLRMTAGQTISVHVVPAGQGRYAVLGSAPVSATRASLDFGRFGTAGVEARGGLIAQMLPAEVSDEAVAKGEFVVTYRDERDEELPEAEAAAEEDTSIRQSATIGVLNATAVAGVSAEYRRDLTGSGWTVAGTAEAGERQETSTVYFTDDSDKDAARVLAKEIGVERIAAMEPEIARLVPGAKVIILAGRDRLDER